MNRAKIVNIESEDDNIEEENENITVEKGKIEADYEKDLEEGKLVFEKSDSSEDREHGDHCDSRAGANSIKVYQREILIQIGELELSEEIPDNFPAILERFPDCDYIIFPSVPKPESMEDIKDLDKDKSDFCVPETLCEIEDYEVEDQIDKFIELVKMSEKQVDEMNVVSNALVESLASDFPHCKAFPFGSSASGLGFKGCDLDIYLELGDNVKDEAFHMKAGMWGAKFKTRKVSEILRRVERFKSSNPIIFARTPIIRLKERKTGIKCDINVASSMGVKNTKYLAFCKENDSRCWPLISVLKFFSDKQMITGSGKGDHLNSYTLVLMIIFFLQTRNILHPVETLQEGVEEDIEEGWNFALCQDKSKLPELKNNDSSVVELLSDFFMFFQEFPYDSHVICPLVGQAITKYNIRHGTYLPKRLDSAPFFGRKRDKLEVGKKLVVQDPFELTRNVGGGASRNKVEHMVQEFTVAHQLLEDLKTKKKVKFWMLFEPGMCSYRNLLENHFDLDWMVLDTDGDDDRRETGLVLQASYQSESEDMVMATCTGDQSEQDSEAVGQLEYRHHGRLLVNTHTESIVPVVIVEDQMALCQIEKFKDRKPPINSCVEVVTNQCNQVKKDNLDQDSPHLPVKRRPEEVVHHTRPPIGVGSQLTCFSYQTQFRPLLKPDQSRQPVQVQSKASHSSVCCSSPSKSSDHAIQVLFYHQSLRFPPPYQNN